MQGIYVVSEKNNSYFYNNETGFIEFKGKHKEDAIKDDELNENKIDENENDEIRWAKAEEVKEDLFAGGGFRQLILEVTQNCNLACKYCCFGSHYKSTRPPSREMMTYETGKKAVDQYMSLFSQKNYMNPGKNPSIGFYGGEPLLNFKLIKDIVEYMDKAYPQYKHDYNVTTNGVLLTDEIIDFLVKYNFAVSISLDGDKKNHDRNRIKVNGEGSYDEVIDSVNRFRNKYPNYFKLSFASCYDYGSDLEALKKFIEEKDIFIVALNMISSIETDYYNQFTEEDRDKFYKTLNKLLKEFIELAKKDELFTGENNIYSPLFLVSYLDLCARGLTNQKRREFLPYGGCCVPGEKIFVSTDGKLHACERISNKFSIGDVDSGLDYDKAAALINKFNQNQPKCKKCNVSHLCNLCYSKFTCGDKIIVSDELCDKVRKDTRVLLTNYVNIMEENPETFDKITANYFRDLSEKTNSTLF